MDTSRQLSADEDGDLLDDQNTAKYREIMTGCLMYVCRGTRPPDIAYSVGVLVVLVRLIMCSLCCFKAAVAAESFMAAAVAIKEAHLWLKKLFPNLGVIDEDEAVKIMCDYNESAEAVLRSPPRIIEVSKHISRQWNFAKESVALNAVKIEYVITAKQVADIFTKPLERQKFEAGRLA
ncbi:hypothetical protein CEUSTIGMA_g7325.t1 [Chlamydomonas eustigma]|uniref:Reverse transcriptase Ty1/copia-type domain-containing protein n=1 Tax=Chlamydomonas eustigma TaxID=1157962 RepID=A0A250X9V7_9CHLO|nr:hypothetical protein CEUSTIGMA_g7325.t1 [Chlamydomonas eustigma]|eukprot:GAX79885.1 hypothetical protein CEUSTIGMA_g7325.t1 [Chlamydomonas eustigma]